MTSPVMQHIARVEGGYPYNGLRNPIYPNILLQRMRMAKGGVIGTNGKGVIALRFDDGQNVFKTSVYPLLIARGLPASMALVSRFTTQSWGNQATWDDIRTWYRNGIEIWSHGTDHLDPTPDGYAGLVREIVTSKAEIEAQGIKCQGWSMPGVTPLTGATPYDGYGITTDDYASYNTDTGRLLANTYALVEAELLGSRRPLPCGLYHGLSHVTVSDGITLAAAQSVVDEVVKHGYGVELMCHPANLGTAGKMSLADFTSLLDYIVTKWDAGLLEVLTPSGLMFADPTTSYRVNLIRDGDFENVSAGNYGGWSETPAGNWTGITIESDGGHGGAKYLRISDTTTALILQRPIYLRSRGFGGETWLAEAWVRGNSETAGTARIIVQDYDDTSRLSLDKTKTGLKLSSGWQRFRFAFSLHPNTDRITVAIGRYGGGGVDFDDVRVVKV